MTQSPSRPRRRTLLGVGLVVGIFVSGCAPTPTEKAAPQPVAVTDGSTKVFPLDKAIPFTDTMGAARSGGRSHEGQDLMAPKMTQVVAVVSGTISQIKHTNSGNAGNQVRLTGDDGYDYYYIHLNNDSPGTDDGRNRFDQAFADGLRVGQRVAAGQPIGYVGDSGNAESTAPHLHFEMHQRGVGVVNAYPMLKAAAVAPLDISATRPFGGLDSAAAIGPNTVRVTGWALAASGEEVVAYSVFVDGSPFAVGQANAPRPDIGAIHGRGPNHGFELTFGGVASGSREICVVLYNSGAGGGNRTNCAQVAVG